MRAGTRLIQPSGSKLYSTTGRLVSQESPAPGVYWVRAEQSPPHKVVVVP